MNDNPFHREDRVRLSADVWAQRSKHFRRRQNAATVVNEPMADNIGIVWYGNKITSIEYWHHTFFELIPPEDQANVAPVNIRKGNP